MDQPYLLARLTYWGIAAFFVLLYVWSYSSVLRRLRENHGELFAELGSPSFLRRDESAQLRRFLRTGHRHAEDPRLSRRCHLVRLTTWAIMLWIWGVLAASFVLNVSRRWTRW